MTTLRTFIAIELDERLRTGLGQVQDLLQAEFPPRTVRWVRPEGIHLTLKFLGDTTTAQVDQVRASLARAAVQVQPFTFTVGGLGCFPNTRQLRVVWVALQEPTGALERLRDAVEAQIAPLGFPTERRPFRPHLTLGRVQRRASKSEVRAVGEVLAAQQGPFAHESPGARAGLTGQVGEMKATSVSYIKSDLRPTGAVYTTLADCRLGGNAPLVPRGDNREP
jgi:2'-5' RNA ligase